MHFMDFNVSTRRVLTGIWGGGVASVAVMVGVPVLRGDAVEFGLPVVAFIIFTTLAELFPVNFEGRYEITVSTVFLVAAILVFRHEPELIGLIAAVAALASNMIARKPWYKVATNVSLAVTTVVVAWVAFSLVGDQDPAHLAGASAAMLIVYFLADTIPMTLLLTVLEERRFAVTYVNNYRGVVVEMMAMEFFGVLFWIIWSVSPWLTPLFALPVVILRQAYFQVERLRSESITALGAIADLIEDRDTYTHNHTESVSTYARRLAERLDMSADDVERAAVAGRVHDLGKIAISDAILLKPGKLTPEEMKKMQEHCSVGYQVLARFSSLTPIADLILAHHERYDGQGYPRGLRADKLPKGAAIIAVADAYDAMTTDRPYRKAMPADQALDIIRQGLGTQWHPVVGATFIQMILEDQARQQSDKNVEFRHDVAS
jgi:HD-GYP domain-containing protein (c-di-GMP phosphodiesterase class II)